MSAVFFDAVSATYPILPRTADNSGRQEPAPGGPSAVKAAGECVDDCIL
jgi:hypothetical protein